MSQYYNYRVGYDALSVDARFAVTLADNGEQGDSRRWLKAAPAINEAPGQVAMYVTGNGDPTEILTLSGEGEIVWYLGKGEPKETEATTIADVLETFGQFIGHTPYECAAHCADLFAGTVESPL